MNTSLFCADLSGCCWKHKTFGDRFMPFDVNYFLLIIDHHWFYNKTNPTQWQHCFYFCMSKMGWYRVVCRWCLSSESGMFPRQRCFSFSRNLEWSLCDRKSLCGSREYEQCSPNRWARPHQHVPFLLALFKFIYLFCQNNYEDFIAVALISWYSFFTERPGGNAEQRRSRSSTILHKKSVPKRHTASHLQDSASKMYKCSYCQYSGKVKRKLTEHMKLHSIEKMHKCNICGKSFNQSSKVAVHMRTHTGERPYKCVVCGKAFTQSSNLVVHMRTHTGERPYKCSVCGKAYIQLNNMLVHLKSHKKFFTLEDNGGGFVWDRVVIWQACSFLPRPFLFCLHDCVGQPCRIRRGILHVLQRPWPICKAIAGISILNGQ